MIYLDRAKYDVRRSATYRALNWAKKWEGANPAEKHFEKTHKQTIGRITVNP